MTREQFKLNLLLLGLIKDSIHEVHYFINNHSIHILKKTNRVLIFGIDTLSPVLTYEETIQFIKEHL